MPTKSLGTAPLIKLSADIVGDLEPRKVEIELVRFDMIDHRLLVVSGEGSPLTFKASMIS